MKSYREIILYFKFKVMNQMIRNVYSMHIYIHKESTKEISQDMFICLTEERLVYGCLTSWAFDCNKTNVFTLYIKQTVRFTCSIVTNKEMNDYTNITLRIGRCTYVR